MSEALPEPDQDASEYRPIHPRGRMGELGRKLAAPLAALAGLALKFKAVFFALGNVKLLTTASTMAVSTAAYAWLWGWKFGVGLVLLLLVHELGHVLELRRQGLPATAPMFIPFLGAVVGLKQLPADAWREARVALAGPLLGGLAAAACWVLGSALNSHFLVALAFTGFLLNLFNLIPVSPLDGGRAAAALHPTLWAVGLAGLVVLAFLRPNPILFIVLAVGAFELVGRWKRRGTDYYRVTPSQRVAVAVAYVGLAALLAVGMTATHIPRSF